MDIAGVINTINNASKLLHENAIIRAEQLYKLYRHFRDNHERVTFNMPRDGGLSEVQCTKFKQFFNPGLIHSMTVEIAKRIIRAWMFMKAINRALPKHSINEVLEYWLAQQNDYYDRLYKCLGLKAQRLNLTLEKFQRLFTGKVVSDLEWLVGSLPIITQIRNKTAKPVLQNIAPLDFAIFQCKGKGDHHGDPMAFWTAIPRETLLNLKGVDPVVVIDLLDSDSDEAEEPSSETPVGDKPRPPKPTNESIRAETQNTIKSGVKTVLSGKEPPRRNPSPQIRSPPHVVQPQPREKRKSTPEPAPRERPSKPVATLRPAKPPRTKNPTPELDDPIVEIADELIEEANKHKRKRTEVTPGDRATPNHSIRNAQYWALLFNGPNSTVSVEEICRRSPPPLSIDFMLGVYKWKIVVIIVPQGKTLVLNNNQYYCILSPRDEQLNALVQNILKKQIDPDPTTVAMFSSLALDTFDFTISQYIYNYNYDGANVDNLAEILANLNKDKNIRAKVQMASQIMFHAETMALVKLFNVTQKEIPGTTEDVCEYCGFLPYKRWFRVVVRDEEAKNIERLICLFCASGLKGTRGVFCWNSIPKNGIAYYVNHNKAGWPTDAPPVKSKGSVWVPDFKDNNLILYSPNIVSRDKIDFSAPVLVNNPEVDTKEFATIPREVRENMGTVFERQLPARTRLEKDYCAVGEIPDDFTYRPWIPPQFLRSDQPLMVEKKLFSGQVVLGPRSASSWSHMIAVNLT